MGWFDSCGTGFYPNIADYDLKSAYPAEMWNLPNLDDAMWVDGLGNESQLFYGLVR